MFRCVTAQSHVSCTRSEQAFGRKNIARNREDSGSADLRNLRSNASSDGHGIQGQSVDQELSIHTSFILTHQQLE